ncbi:MAG: hypothetical protein U1F41_08435 [Burkholderiales bacterium]
MVLSRSTGAAGIAGRMEGIKNLAIVRELDRRQDRVAVVALGCNGTATLDPESGEQAVSKTATSPATSAVESAIARILGAEAAAREAIAQAERDAVTSVEAARAKAQEIATRAEARVRKAGDAYERETAARLAAIADGARAADDPHASLFDEAHLAGAVAALAARLTGERS